MKVEEFIDLYFYKEWVQDLLERINLPSRGIKKELILRLRREGNCDIFQLMKYLDKSDLKEVCDDLGIPRSGRKYELVRRVLEEISKDWSDDYFISEMIRAAENHSWTEKDLERELGYLYERYKKGVTAEREPIESLVIPSPKSFNELKDMIEKVENTEQVRVLQDLINRCCESGEITSKQRNTLLKKLVKVSKKFKDQEAAVKFGPFEFGFRRKKR